MPSGVLMVPERPPLEIDSSVNKVFIMPSVLCRMVYQRLWVVFGLNQAGDIPRLILREKPPRRSTKYRQADQGKEQLDHQAANHRGDEASQDRGDSQGRRELAPRDLDKNIRLHGRSFGGTASKRATAAQRHRQAGWAMTMPSIRLHRPR